MLIRFTLFAVEFFFFLTLFSLNCLDLKTKLLPNKSAVDAVFHLPQYLLASVSFVFIFLVETFRLTLGITRQLP